MNKDFEHIDSLIEEVKKDKAADGANSSILNRYPVRFVLFDNFADSKDFVSELIGLVRTKLLQKSEMRKDIVIELSYKGFS